MLLLYPLKTRHLRTLSAGRLLSLRESGITNYSARQKPLVVYSVGAGFVTVTFSVLQASVE